MPSSDRGPRYVPSTELLLLVVFPTCVTLLLWSMDVRVSRPIWARVLILSSCYLLWFRLGKKWLQTNDWSADPPMRSAIFRWMLIFIPVCYLFCYFVCTYVSPQPFGGFWQFLAFAAPTSIILEFHVTKNY